MKVSTTQLRKVIANVNASIAITSDATIAQRLVMTRESAFTAVKMLQSGADQLTVRGFLAQHGIALDSKTYGRRDYDVEAIKQFANTFGVSRLRRAVGQNVILETRGAEKRGGSGASISRKYIEKPETQFLMMPDASGTKLTEHRKQVTDVRRIPLNVTVKAIDVLTLAAHSAILSRGAEKLFADAARESDAEIAKKIRRKAKAARTRAARLLRLAETCAVSQDAAIARREAEAIAAAQLAARIVAEADAAHVAKPIHYPAHVSEQYPQAKRRTKRRK